MKTISEIFKTLFIVIFIFLTLSFLAYGIGLQLNKPVQDGKTSTPEPTRQDSFMAGVNFTGTEFVISNLDKHTCQNARMQVNGSYTLEGYNLESALDSTLIT